MQRNGVGRTSFNRAYLGSVKSSTMGIHMGKHAVMKNGNKSSPAAFDRPEMNNGVKSFASTMR